MTHANPSTYNLSALAVDRPSPRDVEEFVLQLADRTGLPARAVKAIEAIVSADYDRATQHIAVLTRK